jgi:hypothetical protein
VGDHGKAAAGVARARGLDGRVQRQQIGLLGDRLDQRQHAVDALRYGCMSRPWIASARQDEPKPNARGYSSLRGKRDVSVNSL